MKGIKKTLLLDEYTIMVLQKYGMRKLGSDNISSAVRAIARLECIGV